MAAFQVPPQANLGSPESRTNDLSLSAQIQAGLARQRAQANVPGQVPSIAPGDLPATPSVADVARAEVLRQYGLADSDEIATIRQAEQYQPSQAYYDALAELERFAGGIAVPDGTAAAQSILTNGRHVASAARGQSTQARNDLLGGSASAGIATQNVEANTRALGATSRATQQILENQLRANETVARNLEEIDALVGPLRAEQQRQAAWEEQQAANAAALAWKNQIDGAKGDLSGFEGQASEYEAALDAWEAEWRAANPGAPIEEMYEQMDEVVEGLTAAGARGFTDTTHTQNSTAYILDVVDNSTDPVERRGVGYAVMAYESLYGVDGALTVEQIREAIDNDPKFTTRTDRQRIWEVARSILGIDETGRPAPVANIEAQMYGPRGPGGYVIGGETNPGFGLRESGAMSLADQIMADHQAAATTDG